MTPLSIAALGRWSQWQGLDSGLVDEDVTRAFDVPSDRVEADAGRLSHRTLDARTVWADEEPALRWWLDEEDAVLLVQVADPACQPPLHETLAALGPPDREGAGRYRVLGATTTELVWARRGLSLTVAASYDNPPTAPDRLAAALLFEPTDLGRFVAELGGDDRGGPSW